MIAFLIPLLAAVAGNTYQIDKQIADFRVIRAADERVARIGEQLAIGNIGLCPTTQQRTGLVLHDIRQYAGYNQDAVKAAFLFAGPVSVEAVLPGSGADHAGVPVNAAIVTIDGEEVASTPPAPGQPAAFARMAAVLDRIDGLADDGVLKVELLVGEARRSVAITPRLGCRVRFQLVSGGVNAASDGFYVKINSAMYDFAESDADIAAVLAHELAHNVLDHRQRLNAAGVDRGMFATLGKSGGLIRGTEIEADRLSLYLLANAGYDPDLAIAFWDRLGAKHGYGIFSDGTHLRRKPRVAMLRKELAVLGKLKAATGEGALIPGFARPPFAPLE